MRVFWILRSGTLRFGRLLARNFGRGFWHTYCYTLTDWQSSRECVRISLPYQMVITRQNSSISCIFSSRPLVDDAGPFEALVQARDNIDSGRLHLTYLPFVPLSYL